MPLGFYYSPPDMHRAGYRDTTRPVTENWMGEPDRPEWGSYLDSMEADLRALLTSYGEVAILWFDGLFDHDRYDPPRFARLIRELSPNTLINDRLGSEIADYITPEQTVPDGIPVRRTSPPTPVTAEMFKTFLDLLTQGRSREELARTFAAVQKARLPTAAAPASHEAEVWETCMTLNDTWGYNPLDENYKSTHTLIRTLIETASRSGNLLLNVGPTDRGTFPAAAIERLQGIGAWMSRNGEAIHGTTYGPIQGRSDLRSTAAPGRIYLHLIEPPPRQLVIEDLDAPVRKASILGAPEPLHFEQQGNRVTLELGTDLPGAPPAVIELLV
jgi:alpha-L-fucosidase